MKTYTLLDLVALALALIHFGAPLAYYWYLRRRWLNRPWNVRMNPSYTPKITVLVPTYMGAKYIASRLGNIYEQSYPRDKIEIIVVDSASPDGTADRVREWIGKHPDIKVKLIVEPERRGKLSAVLEGLKHVSKDTEIVVLTDDDCIWDKNALKNVTKYFADPIVGAVTGSIRYLDDKGLGNTYREFYNQVRIAESKWWSTPIHNGPLLALRKTVIDKIGLPTFPGADDSAFASYIAFAGYRAIQADDAWVYEYAEKQYKRLIRRATHLATYFIKLKRYTKKHGVYKKTKFDTIWRIEAYLHLVNPWLLIAAATLLATLAATDYLALALLLSGLALLALKPYRMWIFNQLTLVIALIRSLVTKDIVWRK